MASFTRILRRNSGADKTGLINIRIASPCPADWSKMIGDERVRHCSECNLNVYNLSAMTERQVQELIAGSPGKRLCTRFYRRPDDTVLTQDCPWSLRVLKRRASRIAAAVFAAMMSACPAYGKKNAQQTPQQTSANHQARRGIWILVVDQTGAMVSGANVRLIGSNGKEIAHAKTSDSGPLFIPPLSTGQYSLVIDAPGFRKLSQQVVLREDKLEDLKATLQVYEEVIGIFIETGEPLVQKESTVCATFEGKMLGEPSTTLGPNRGPASMLHP